MPGAYIYIWFACRQHKHGDKPRPVTGILNERLSLVYSLLYFRDSLSAGLVIERLRVRISAGAAGEFSSPELCMLTLIRCPFHPRVTAMARKRPRSFCQRCRWKVTPKHGYTFDPTKSEWAGYARCPGIVWEPIRKRAHTQLVREHSATVVSAR